MSSKWSLLACKGSRPCSKKLGYSTTASELWGSKSVQKGIRGLGAMEDAWKMGGLQQSVFNNLDRIRQNTENSLHVAALCFVGNTYTHQAVLTAGFQKNKGRPSVKREGDPWQNSVTKLREQPPLTPSRDVKALCPSRTTPWVHSLRIPPCIVHP